jgi:MFS transporter, DHA1 family, multidrug resistance protein
MTKNSSSKNQDLFIITSIVMVLMSANLVSLTYSNVFKEIADFFNVSKDHVAYIPRANFTGIAIGSILSGVLCNLYGKKVILLYGLLLLAIGSIISSFTDNFSFFITSFFVMGLAKSICTVSTSTIILDKYTDLKHANKMILLTRVILLVLLAASPVLLLMLAKLTYWRIFFNSILVFSIAAFILTQLLLDTKEDQTIKKVFNFKKVFNDYKSLFTNFTFTGNALIYAFPAILVSLYINNISIILVGTTFTPKEYTLYASGIFLVNFIFSALSIYITNKKGLTFNQNIGFFMALIASLRLISIPAQKEYLMFFPLYLCTAGMAMMNGFFIKASTADPNKKALAVSLVVTVTNLLTARAIYWSQLFYDKTLTPSQDVTLILTIVATILFIILKRKEFREKAKKKK